MEKKNSIQNVTYAEVTSFLRLDITSWKVGHRLAHLTTGSMRRKQATASARLTLRSWGETTATCIFKTLLMP
jgi:hypothetical protein